MINSTSLQSLSYTHTVRERTSTTLGGKENSNLELCWNTLTDTV